MSFPFCGIALRRAIDGAYFYTEFRLSKKDGIPIRVDNSADANVRIIKHLVAPVERYPYRMKDLLELVNRQLRKRKVRLVYKTELGWKPPDKELEGIDGKIEQMLMRILHREGMDDDIAQTVECINAGEWGVGISLGFEALLHEHIKLDEESLELFGKFARWRADDAEDLDDDFLEQYESFKKL